MFLSGQNNIKEVLLYPAMKPDEQHKLTAPAGAAVGAPGSASSGA
jgi:hypothetical protein